MAASDESEKESKDIAISTTPTLSGAIQSDPVQVKSTTEAEIMSVSIESDQSDALKESRRERRLAMNRESARSRRKRKKELMGTLACEVQELRQRLQKYEEILPSLQKQNQELTLALQQANAVIAAITAGDKNPGNSHLPQNQLQQNLAQAQSPQSLNSSRNGIIGNITSLSPTFITNAIDQVQSLLRQQQPQNISAMGLTLALQQQQQEQQSQTQKVLIFQQQLQQVLLQQQQQQLLQQSLQFQQQQKQQQQQEPR